MSVAGGKIDASAATSHLARGTAGGVGAIPAHTLTVALASASIGELNHAGPSRATLARPTHLATRAAVLRIGLGIHALHCAIRHLAAHPAGGGTGWAAEIERDVCLAGLLHEESQGRGRACC